jgi:hypothetical protein
MAGDEQLALDAKQFLESPVCRHVFDEVVRVYRRELEESKPEDAALREHCYHMLKATRELHRQLTLLSQKGKLALVNRMRSVGGDEPAA